MKIYLRIFGSLMDKIFILILFLLTFIAIYQYSAPTYLGTFWGGCLYEIPNTYKFTEAAGCEYSLKEIDITVVTVFSIVNFLYYFLFESTLKASLGKYICGGIACTEDEKTISVKDAFLRSLVLILFIVVAVTIRFSILQVSYIFLFLLFFCVLDLPILFKKKSLVDIATDTFYVSRKSLKEDKITSPEDKQTLVIKKNNSKVNTLFCILGFLIVGITYSSYRFSKELNLLHNMNSFIKVNNNSFKNYEREQLSVLKGTGYFTDSLEHKTLDELNALGPVPYGKVISTIGGTELGTYSYNVPRSEYNDKPDWYWGLYSETRYKDFEYKYSLTTIDISKFYTDSNDTEITTDEIYKELKRNLGSFENKEFSLSDYSAHIRWSLYYDSIPKNTHSISYWTCDEKRIPVIRSIILANKRAYVLEVKSEYYTLNEASKLLKQFTTFYLPNYFGKVYDVKEKFYIYGLGMFLLLIAICINIYSLLKVCKEGNCKLSYNKCSHLICILICIIIFIISYNIFKFSQFPKLNFRLPYGYGGIWYECDKTYLRLYAISVFSVILYSLIVAILKYYKNKANAINPISKKILVYISIAFLINILVCYLLLSYVTDKTIIFDNKCKTLLNLFGLSILINSITLPYTITKLYDKVSYDAILPSWMKKYFNKRCISEQERKSFVSLIAYPLLILGNLPLGAYILIYIIPVTLLFFMIVETRRLMGWINGKSYVNIVSNNKDTAVFKDYYLILDLPLTASEDDVNSAYNKIIARNNANPNMYGKQFIDDVNEAYRVLSSTNNVRPKYDKEYTLYKATNDRIYKFSNSQTEKEILYIQESIAPQQKKQKRMPIVNNAVFLAILILIAILLIFISIVYQSYNNGNYDCDSIYYKLME
ncbi:RDD family protein [uncultured Prevotella sp.]|uniref:RDD family protein n=1 Tax=uncultured Prevotella sp. TaxID=159272 RepID=UPI0028063987|nr:RDD family protein [uncultured Prevotella sp.]